MSKLKKVLCVAGTCAVWNLCASAALISENFDATGLATNTTVNGLTLGGSLGVEMSSNSDYVLGTNALGGFVTGEAGATGNRAWHVGFTETDVPDSVMRFTIDVQCYDGMGGQDFGLYVGSDDIINTAPIAIRLSPSGSDTKISVRSFGDSSIASVSTLSGGGIATYVIEYDFENNLVTEVSVNGDELLADYTPTSSVAVAGVGGRTFGIEAANGGPMLDNMLVESIPEPGSVNLVVVAGFSVFLLRHLRYSK